MKSALVICFLAAVIICGCGGSGSGATGTTTSTTGSTSSGTTGSTGTTAANQQDVAGTYAAMFNRPGGMVQVVIPDTGQATATVTDGATGTYTGNVTVSNVVPASGSNPTSTASVNGTLSNGSESLTINATVRISTGLLLIQGSLTGAFSITFSGGP